MKLVVVLCHVCGAATEEIERGGVPPYCKTCGLKELEVTALRQLAQGDVARLSRAQRIEGLARLAGRDANRRARDGGWWDEAVDRGDDPNDLLVEAYWDEVETRIAREVGVLAEDERDLALDAAADGWASSRS